MNVVYNVAEKIVRGDFIDYLITLNYKTKAADDVLRKVLPSFLRKAPPIQLALQFLGQVVVLEKFSKTRFSRVNSRGSRKGSVPESLAYQELLPQDSSNLAELFPKLNRIV